MFVFKAAVVGAGTMGGEIAWTIANVDIPVVLKDVKQEFVDAGPILDQAIESARPLVDLRGHTLDVSMERGRLPLHVDATRFEQIVVNLLTNAAKYTETGGRIWLTAAPEGDQVVIRVRDNGTGIPPEKLEAVFEPFVQLDRTLTSAHEGTGLGLAISRDLARGMGGDLVARHEAGRGAVLVLTLPRG